VNGVHGGHVYAFASAVITVWVRFCFSVDFT
jgi:hypothetical protein